MPKLYVVRHAEPKITGVLLGSTDPELSADGRLAAERTLSDMRVDRVFTSPLRRCAQTAQFIDAPVTVDENMREIHHGEWDGLGWAEIEERYPELAARKARDWFKVTPPGGERWDDFAARVQLALRTILEPPVSAAIVGHVAVNAVIVQSLTGSDPAEFNQPYCGVLEFMFTEMDVERLWPKNN